MDMIGAYADSLDYLLEDILGGRKTIKTPEVRAALDGQPKAEVYLRVPIEDIRSAGAFFTSGHLARRAVRQIEGTINKSSVFYDPACGAGDLLIAASRRLEIGYNLKSTLREWGQRLRGIDIHNEFTRLTKTRLALEALRRGAKPEKCKQAEAYRFLSEIRNGCGIDDGATYASASHIIMNPPFSMVQIPKPLAWASGKVNCAALFLEASLTKSREGTRVVAFLPDVLRSGPRYEKWRAAIEKKCSGLKVRSIGRFDNKADVDVFMATLCVGGKGKRLLGNPWRYPRNGRIPRLQDYFDIHVGPVVSYRSPKTGSWRPFLCSRGIPAWETMCEISKKRRFPGRVFNPPFVVVKRTSRPEDVNRAVGAVVLGSHSVAVENHLIVLLPKSGDVRICHELVRRLQKRKTTEWLNQRGRCRHLSVTALKDLPWWEDE